MAAELLTDEWLAAVGAALVGLSGAGTGEATLVPAASSSRRW